MIFNYSRVVRLALHIVTLFTITLFLLPASLYAHKEYVHQYLAIEAYRLLLDRYPGLASSEFAAHIGTQSGNCEGFPFTQATITAGAYREDCEDPVYHYGDVVPPLDAAYFSASHFWDADGGDQSTISICDFTCTDYQNAYRKSLRYVLPSVYGRWTAKLTWPAGYASFYLQAGGTGSIFHNGMIGFEYDSLTSFFRDGRCSITGYIDINGRWQTASTVPDRLPLKIIAPKNVRDRIAWEVIGRITHLLGDMGVPAHAHNDIHPPFWWNNEPADIFEEEMARIHTAWDHRDAVDQGHLLDSRLASPAGRHENAMRYFFYTTNQVADRFPSNDANGDSRFERSWMGDDYSVLGILDEVETSYAAGDIFHPEAADYAFVFSIRSIAGLFHWFAAETGILATFSVEADVEGAVVHVDGKPQATPASLKRPAGTAFTLEARDQPVTDPVTNTPITLRFREWERFLPATGGSTTTTRLLSASAVDGARYRARFDPEVTLSILPLRHLDGGAGGRYSLNGSDVGSGWTGTLNTGTYPSVTIGMTPPVGSVFLRWSDGVRDNPRVIRPTGSLSLHAICKQRLFTTVSPTDRPAGQRRIAFTGSSGSASTGAVLAYASAGNVFFSESANGTTWTNEELVNDGLGNARDPSIDYFINPFEGTTGAIIVWEESISGGAGYRIISRVRDMVDGQWGGPTAVHSDASRRPSRATPVVSAEVVAWRGPDGILVKMIGDEEPVVVPGTDAGSESPVLDYYSVAERKFGLSWLQNGTLILFRRGTWPGPSWSVARTVAAVTPGESLRSPDLALNASGSGCAAWALSSGGGWNVHYRWISASDSMQSVTAMSGCSISSPGAPLPRLEHHRLDATGVKDIGLHTWNPTSGILLSLLLRSGTRTGPTGRPIAGTDPDIPRAGFASSGGTPVLAWIPRGGSGWTLSISPTALAPSLPMPATTLAPPSGKPNVGSVVQLSWQCSADAETYGLQVSRGPSFSSPLVLDRVGIAGKSFTVSNLEPGTTYYWRVRAYNSLGGGAFSAASSFSTSAPPAAPQLSGTTVSSGGATHPRLSWSTPPGVTSFSLYRYLCVESDDCVAAALRPALVYEGTATTFTDGNIAVGGKSAAARAYYYVKGKAGGFSSAPSNVLSFATQENIIWGEPPPDRHLPEASGLGDNYPNPFNPSTTIPYALSTDGVVTLAVYNLLGQRVALLVDGPRAAGYHDVPWHATGNPAGVYLLVLDIVETASGGMVRDRRKLVLLK